MSQLPDTETAAASTPKAEFEVDDALVHALLKAQAPAFSHLPIERVAEGWDNVTYRLGADYAVRLPRRDVGAMLIAREQMWLPRLAPHLNLPVPTPIAVGQPGTGFPWPWSILPWIEGEAADLAEPNDQQADRLVGFLKSLHAPAPDDAPANPVRGVPLETRARGVEERLQRLEANTDLETDQLWPLWHAALAAPATSRRVWLHGDLHARNVLVSDGVISGVIDWGDVTAGDPATDLASIWMLLPTRAARQRAMASYGGDGALWARARGWAILFGAVLLETGLTDTPRHAVMGARTLERVAEGP